MLALCTAVSSTYYSRAHNVLSVSPLLKIDRRFDRHDSEIGIFVRNEGTGPAIEDFRLYLDGKKMNDWRHVSALTGVIFPASMIILSNGSAIGSNGVRQLYWSKSSQLENYDHQKYLELLRDRIFFVIEYCFIYKICSIVCTGFDVDKCTSAERSVIAHTNLLQD
jgi:hypothetical protein